MIQGLVSQLQENDQNLRIKSLRFWSSISNKDKTFDHKQKIIQAMLNISLTDIKVFIKEKIMNNFTLNNRDRVILYTNASKTTGKEKEQEKQLNGKIISSLSEFVKESKRKF